MSVPDIAPWQVRAVLCAHTTSVKALFMLPGPPHTTSEAVAATTDASLIIDIVKPALGLGLRSCTAMQTVYVTYLQSV